ncbi:MAG: hypothetical protein ACYDC3_01075 [Candidatus Binataceae bacterium]
MAELLEVLDSLSIDKRLLEPEPQVLNLAQALATSPCFCGVAFLTLRVAQMQVERWLLGIPQGTIISDPGFLSASRGAGYGFDRMRPTAVLRFLGDSAANISSISRWPQDREVVFPPGERFWAVRIHRRYLGKQLGTVSMVDLEQTEWRSEPRPRWPEYDDPHSPRDIPDDE